MSKVIPIALPGEVVVGAVLVALGVFCLWGSIGRSETARAEDVRADRLHAERLAQDAIRAIDRFLLDQDRREVVSDTTITGDPPDRDRSSRSIESGSDWLARVPRYYNALIERLSQPTAPNPVVDAARNLAAERDAILKGARSGTTVTQIIPDVSADPVGTDARARQTGDAAPPWSANPPDGASDTSERRLIDWLNHGYRTFQDDVVGKLATPPVTVAPVAGRDVSTDVSRAVEVAPTAAKEASPSTP